MDADSPTLLLCRSAPGQDDALAEMLDMALTLAVFGQSVALLFLGDGVRHLLAPGNTPGRGCQTTLASLPDYGITGWADEAALAQAGIDAVALPAPVTPLASEDVAALVARARHVWGW